MALHLVGLALLTTLATRDRERSRMERALLAGSVAPVDPAVAAWLGATPEELQQSIDVEMPPPPPEGPPLPPADQANRDVRPAALRTGLPQEQRAPAPDTGEASGRRLPPSWRRDNSTLRARLSDGSEFYQPPRLDMDRSASSPQALRQEPKVAVGDSVRTSLPEPTQAAPPAELPTLTDDQPEVAPALARETVTPELAGLHPTRGEGPLDADRGRRAVDVEKQGLAFDKVAARAGSNETQPGMIDYAAASATGPEAGLPGRGLGATPGLSSHRLTGSAASEEGSPHPRPAPIGEIGEGTSERAFAREYLEIRRRVARVLRFPKRLALLLEQGEAIVQFMVDRDGRVWGDVKLLKSAGFEEFDREAVEVVRRAAPFPQLPQRLLVRMRVPFENPIIR
jgi:periplasmic protein TonB